MDFRPGPAWLHPIRPKFHLGRRTALHNTADNTPAPAYFGGRASEVVEIPLALVVGRHMYIQDVGGIRHL